MSMNRRSFFSRVAAVGAAVPVLRLSASGHPGRSTSLAVEAASTPIVTPSPLASPVLTLQKALLTLRLERGLMAPCPNCRQTAWKAFGNLGMVRCEGCDWQDNEKRLVSPCRCRECTIGPEFYFDRRTVNLTPVWRAHLERDAPVGIYSVWQPGGEPIRRTLLNSYDVTCDRMIHHVVEEQLARVDCAIWLATFGAGFRQKTGQSEQEWFYQPNGNRVVIGWDIVDCYEWQVDRGEKPAITYHRDADGRTTLVQGVVR